MDKLSGSYNILEQSHVYNPLESDSDSNCDFPPFVDLS